jgi:hypothetical protein
MPIAPPPRILEPSRPVIAREPSLTPPSITWLSAAGDELILTDESQGYLHTDGDRLGFGKAAVATQYDELATGGSKLRHRRRLSRTLAWTQHVLADTQAEMSERWDRLVAAFDHPDDKPGRLTITRFDGRARYVDARYVDGLEDEPRAFLDHTTTVRVLAADPYFYAVDPGVFDLQVAPLFYTFYPFYPLTVAPSQLDGSIDVTNPGDADADVVLRITGPAQAPTVRNETTGQEFRLTRSLLAGQVITVDAAAKTVVDDGGASWRRYVAFPGSTLWGLARGVNRIRVITSGATAATRVQGTFRTPYDTP